MVLQKQPKNRHFDLISQISLSLTQTLPWLRDDHSITSTLEDYNNTAPMCNVCQCITLSNLRAKISNVQITGPAHLAKDRQRKMNQSSYRYPTAQNWVTAYRKAHLVGGNFVGLCTMATFSKSSPVRRPRPKLLRGQLTCHHAMATYYKNAGALQLSLVK